MKYGYVRISSKSQVDGNSIEEQTSKILEQYSDAEIITEIFSGAKERAIFSELVGKLAKGDTLIVTKLDRFCRTTKCVFRNIRTANPETSGHETGGIRTLCRLN